VDKDSKNTDYDSIWNELYSYSNPYLADPKLATMKFKFTFLENIGITLSKYFDFHEFDNCLVKCRLDGILDLGLTL